MTVCRFWEQGNCRYGQNCKFEHPSGGRSQGGNRFAAFGNTSGGGTSAGGGGGSAFGGGNTSNNPYNLSKEVIERDLTSETPTWIFSAYGPSRDLPEQLFGGPTREQSFEEMRLIHAMATAAGNPQQAVQEAQQLYQQCQQQNATALQDIDGAIRFIVSSGDKHPNRIDICKQGTQAGNTGAFSKDAPSSSAFGQAQAKPFSSNTTPANNANPFSQNTQNQGQTSAFGGGAAPSSAFGQPSALGQKPNPFGAPAFGQASQPAPAFGQTSQPASAFGKPAFGQAAQPASAFGQGAQNPPSAFGQPSALGQKASPFGAPAFGQTAQPAGNQSAFGQTSALGQKASPFGGAAAAGPSPFAAATNKDNNAASPFSQTNSNTTANPFGQNTANQNNASPFGQTAQNAPGTSPFGQAGQPATSSPFGQASQPAATSPFGQANKPAAANPFGGQPAQASASPFGQTAQPQNAASNPFASAAGSQPNGFGTQNNAAQASPFGQNNTQPNNASPFAQAQGGGGFGSQPAASNPFGGNAAAPQGGNAAASQGGASPYPPGSSKQHPDISSYASKNMTGQLGQWKGRPVSYKDGYAGYQGQNGIWTRIWFPNGAPGYYKDTELPLEDYDDKTKTQWKAFEQSGTFADGMVPALPPMREVCLWDI